MSRGTWSGFAAILLWSTTVAIARSLSERLGPITAAASVYAVSGCVSLAHLALAPERRRRVQGPRRAYLIWCGLLFVGYSLFLFVSLGLAETRQQVLEVGLLNYLWPALTVVLSILLLGHSARLTLVPGTLLALSGVVLVLGQGSELSWTSAAGNVSRNPTVYLLGLAAATSWALYSNLVRRLSGGTLSGGVGLFLPATGVAMLLLTLVVEEPRAWTGSAVVEALVLGILTYVAYNAWDRAMRRGNVVLVAAASYLTPLLSTLVSVVYLDIATTLWLWVGCVVLITGSVVSWRSVEDPSGRAGEQASGSG